MAHSLSGTPFFNIVSHETQAQHLREYDHAVLDNTSPLYLAIKRYTPRASSDTSRPENSLTFIVSPALGIPKEAYEPFFEDLTRALAHKSIHVESFWIADPVQLGQSAVLNRGNIGNDFSWFDHSRDLLQMIQTFRSEMSRPLIGLGHSMGGCQIAWLALIHPGLFESLVLFDPSILRADYGASMVLVGKTMLKRREQWASLDEAVAAIRKNPFYARWDPRVIAKMVEHQFIPVQDSPSAETQTAVASGELKLTPEIVGSASARHVEFNTAYRRRRTDDYIERLRTIDEKLYMKASSSSITAISPWFPSSGITIFNFLPFLRPDVMYIVGEKSDFSSPWLLEKRLKETGTGFGASGGAIKGRVKQHIVNEGGHYDIFDERHKEEIVNVTVEHLVGVHIEFGKKLAEWKEWQGLDPRVQQTPDSDLVRALEAWKPSKGDSMMMRDKKGKAKI